MAGGAEGGAAVAAVRVLERHAHAAPLIRLPEGRRGHEALRERDAVVVLQVLLGAGVGAVGLLVGQRLALLNTAAEVARLALVVEENGRVGCGERGQDERGPVAREAELRLHLGALDARAVLAGVVLRLEVGQALDIAADALAGLAHVSAVGVVGEGADRARDLQVAAVLGCDVLGVVELVGAVCQRLGALAGHVRDGDGLGHAALSIVGVHCVGWLMG